LAVRSARKTGYNLLARTGVRYTERGDRWIWGDLRRCADSGPANQGSRAIGRVGARSSEETFAMSAVRQTRGRLNMQPPSLIYTSQSGAENARFCREGNTNCDVRRP
jgi:hypothetical protein